MKTRLSTILCSGLFLLLTGQTSAQELLKFNSPDNKVMLTLSMDNGQPKYEVGYDNKQVIAPSPLGLVTNMGDFSKDLKLKHVEKKAYNDQYAMRNIKHQ